jgi:glucose-1-phosphate thymidylyltransferase
MKVLILAAGKGTRLYPLTKDTPKPLVEVNGKSVMQYNIERLIEYGIKDIGIVIQKQYHEMFEEALYGYSNINIEYIYQKKQLGISHAILASHKYLRDEDKFIVLLGDNLILSELDEFMKAAKDPYNDCVLSLKLVQTPQDFGIIRVQRYLEIDEKPEVPDHNMAVMGLYAFNKKIWEALTYTPLNAKGEYNITDSINILNTDNYKLYLIDLLDVGTHDRLEKAKEVIKDKGW